MMNKRINGIKMSTELVQVNINKHPGNMILSELFFRQLAEKHINVPFLCLTHTDSQTIASCCVAAEDFIGVEEVIASEPDMKQYLEIIASVGSLTIFPHQNSFKLLGIMINIFKENQLPIYGIGSSISSLTINTDFRLLNSAAKTLESVFKLPANHTPFSHEFRVKQI